MSRTRHADDDDDDDDEELPEGVYHDDELPTVSCPYCKADILEEAQYCPRCENYLSREDAPPAGKPLWIWVLLIVGTLAMIFSAFQ